MAKWLNLFAGGVAGTAARYALSGAIYRMAGSTFPYGTLIVNLIGCLIAGVLAGLSEHNMALNPQTKLLLIVGFCGAFTTFSAFMMDTAVLVKGGQAATAFLNIAVSVIGGFLALLVGLRLASLVSSAFRI